ncbi:MAG TPA: hypothetical protein VJR92_05825 [Gemmatimonadaceae bacterium]|nr:hypothetical protein [Gemmatimonadaceae bacterium]
MQRKAFSLSRSVWAVAALGALATACDRDEGVSPRTSARSVLALQVSDAVASTGEHIGVVIATESGVAPGGVQGFLRFDPTRLRFVGQERDTGDEQIMLVNTADAQAGVLRLAVLDPDDMTRSGTLVFEVVAGGYTSMMSFTVEEAAMNGSPVQRMSVDMERAVKVNPLIDADDSVGPISVDEWKDIVAQFDVARGIARDPGEIRNGLKFGDTNFDNAITLSDGLYMINVSVGINELIVGTDGSGATGDRDAVVAGNVFPANAPGLGEPGDLNPPGREADGSRLVTLGDGLAVVNEAVGIAQPVVGDVIPGRPLVPVSNRVIVSANITTNTTWTSNNIYELQGGISVTSGATLTIEPGTQVEGQRGTGPGVGGAALFVSREGRIVADGTQLQPIVFTCVAGPTARFKGCWGGITILGNASLNDGALTSPSIPSRGSAGGCREKSAEGGAGLYGGCNDNDDSGIIRYVRVEYAGFRFTPENELNGLALNGVGRGTIVDFVQVHAGLDDGIEMFGGTVNLKHLVLTANSDDSFDYTEGWSGKAQFVIAQHDSLDSDKGFEQDNYEFNHDATPRAIPQIYNVTLVGKADPASTSGTANNNSVGGMNPRRGTRPQMFNFIVQNFPFAVDIDDASTCVDVNTATGFKLANSIFTQNIRIDNSDAEPAGCGGTELDVLNAAGGNQFPATSPLLSPLNVLVPDWRPAFGTATGGATPPSDGFFDASATFIGAVAPANSTKSNVPWYAGWIRGWQSAITP